MRPRFEIPMPGGHDATWAAMRRALTEPGCPCTGIVLPRHLALDVREEDRHFWSPQLSLEVREDERQGPVLVGKFGPHPHVWGMFMAIYGVLIALATGGAVYGLSQWTLGQAPWALLAIPVAGLLGLFVWGATFIGQGLSAEQMYVLRSFVDRAIEDADPERRTMTSGPEG